MVTAAVYAVELQYMGFEASPLIFPTGVGGILYAPGRLHPDVVDDATFRTLCPSADDAWLYWMGLRGGSQFRRIELARPGSLAGIVAEGLDDSLARFSKGIPPSVKFPRGGGDDVQFSNLIDRFGFPPPRNSSKRSRWSWRALSFKCPKARRPISRSYSKPGVTLLQHEASIRLYSSASRMRRSDVETNYAWPDAKTGPDQVYLEAWLPSDGRHCGSRN